MPQLRVHMLHEPEPDALQHLRRCLSPEVGLTLGNEVPEPADYEVLVAGRPPVDLLEASEALRALIIPWAGLPEPTRDLMIGRPGIAVHNLHHNDISTAEIAVALLLAAAKFLVPLDRALRSGDWSPRYGPNRSTMLEGRRLLVLGYGAVGRHAAKICRGMGMKVTAVRRRAGEAGAQGPDEVRPVEDLHDLLPVADVLLVALPLTEKTRDMIGEKELALLPEHAVLVNVGRGPVVDDGALYEALRDGTIRAAGLDVWYNYPKDAESRASTFPSDHPFHELDNVVMSPHRAGDPGIERVEVLRMERLAASLNAAASGEPIPCPVDVQEGY
jgi:phosphoglycerate dehydrogenase-like enzyme